MKFNFFCLQETYNILSSRHLHDNVRAEANRNGGLCSRICDLLCPRMLPPPNHTPWYTNTQTHTHSHRPGCQSYTNSHPLAAGFQDNHGNQSLTPGETSSRSERLHSISTSQYSTHKRTQMHIFHTLTHTHWQAHIHTHTHEHTPHIHTHTQTWTRPTQPTCSNSLAVTSAFPACLHWGEWELVRETAHYILSPTVLDCTYTELQWNINYTSLIMIKLIFRASRQTLYPCTKIVFSPPNIKTSSIVLTTKHSTIWLHPRWQHDMCILVYHWCYGDMCVMWSNFLPHIDNNSSAHQRKNKGLRNIM